MESEAPRVQRVPRSLPWPWGVFAEEICELCGDASMHAHTDARTLTV